MIHRKTAKDPETFATVQGFILSDELRQKKVPLWQVCSPKRQGSGTEGLAM